MGGGVPVETFELLRDGEHARDGLVLLRRLAQARLLGDRLLKRHRIGRVLRHELRQLVDLAVGHLQHAADVAHDAPGLQRAEGDDLRHALVAIAVLHVADDPLAPVLAEVDVEVRHRDAVGVQEALEQQVEAKRIEVGDLQRIGDEGASARAAAGTNRDPLLLRPADEVRHDQEVAGKAHPLDDGQLEIEPLAIILDGHARHGIVLAEALVEALVRLAAQHLGLVLAFREARQDRRLEDARPVGAAHRDLDRVLDRLGQVAEQPLHLGAGLEAVLRAQPAALVVRHDAAFGDGDERVMRLVILPRAEEGLVGGDDRQRVAIGERQQPRFDRTLRRQPVSLDLDIEPLRKGLRQRQQPAFRDILPAGGERTIDGAVGSAGERDQALGMGGDAGERHMRFVGRVGLHVAGAGETHQVPVADLAHGEEHELSPALAMRRRPARRCLMVAEIDVELQPDDGLYALLRRLLREFERAEEIVRVGERQRRHAVGFRELGEHADRQRPLEQREGGVRVEMDEARVVKDGGHAMLRARTKPPFRSSAPIPAPSR